jgi:hypothetical protein
MVRANSRPASHQVQNRAILRIERAARAAPKVSDAMFHARSERVERAVILTGRCEARSLMHMSMRGQRSGARSPVEEDRGPPSVEF